MRVLVTGYEGYIGSVLCPVLLRAGVEVIGLDAGWYRDCAFGWRTEDIPSLDADIRDVEVADLSRFDAIIHLAGFPEDIDATPAVIAAIQNEASVRLAHQAKAAGVNRFIFASTAAVYGRGGSVRLTESRIARPIHSHARRTLQAEQGILQLSDGGFTPTVLRIVEVYGESPMIRIDTTVNGLVARAVACGRVSFNHGVGGWRSLIHVEDLAGVFVQVLQAPSVQISGQTFNVADSNGPYRVADLVDAVVDLSSEYRRPPFGDAFDEQSRRVDPSRLFETLSIGIVHRPLDTGLRQLHRALVEYGFTHAEFRGPRYRRSAYLSFLGAEGWIDGSFRKAAPLFA